MAIFETYKPTLTEYCDNQFFTFNYHTIVGGYGHIPFNQSHYWEVSNFNRNLDAAFPPFRILFAPSQNFLPYSTESAKTANENMDVTIVVTEEIFLEKETSKEKRSENTENSQSKVHETKRSTPPGECSTRIKE